MNAYSTDFHSQGPDYPDIKPAASPDAEALSGQWAVLQEAGAAVAALAGIEPDEPLLQIRRFIAWAAECRDWRLDLARNGVADLAAILRSGVSALVKVQARGQDVGVAAATLWQEFTAARDALFDLVPEPEPFQPPHSG